MNVPPRNSWTMLGTDVLKQRVAAARILRGLSQEELQDLFKLDGLGKYDAGRVERGEMDMQRVHRDAFCRHLKVPERWFSEPDVDVIVGLRPARKISPSELRADLELLLVDLDRDEGRGAPGNSRSPDGEDHLAPEAGDSPP